MESSVRRRAESVRTAAKPTAASTQRNVKQGAGGIRDIEFTVQFYQLLHGGDDVKLRAVGTLPAIAQLRRVGALTAQDSHLLETAYSFLRTVEHRLQCLYELQRYTIPDDERKQEVLARQMGVRSEGKLDARKIFMSRFRITCKKVRAVFMEFAPGVGQRGWIDVVR